jgi:hypothetical protein
VAFKCRSGASMISLDDVPHRNGLVDLSIFYNIASQWYGNVMSELIFRKVTIYQL